MATAQTLFKIAALLNAVFVPAHVVFGLTDVHPAINTIPNTRQHRVGKRAAQNCYNYVNASLAVAGALLAPGLLLPPGSERSFTDNSRDQSTAELAMGAHGGPEDPRGDGCVLGDSGGRLLVRGQVYAGRGV